MPAPIRAEARTNNSLFPEKGAAALAYFTFVPAILFLSIEPYKKNQFVRYHSVQCLLIWAAAILAAIVLKVVGLVLFLVPVAGPLLVFLAWVVAALVGFISAIIPSYNASRLGIVEGLRHIG